MTNVDNMSLSSRDSVPAWLRTLEIVSAIDGDNQQQLIWQGELFLRGIVQRFIADDSVVDRGLRARVGDTPVLIATAKSQRASKLIQENRNTYGPLILTDLTLMTPGVPIAVGQCLYQDGALSAQQMQYVESLMGIIASVNAPLREFLINLFSTADVAKSFVSNPASYNHHHSQPGGLLIHSVECALMAKHLSSLRLVQSEADITTVAALLHDIGKTQTHRVSRSHYALGQCVTHENAGLEILAPYLKELETHWRVGADLLRHILGWDSTGQTFPAFPGTLLVKLCDQFDTALDRREQTFKDKPRWFGYAQLEGAGSQRFLRIPK